MDRVLRRQSFDLIVLDAMLPGEDGFSICRRLRAASSTPIIMLTALGEDVDRIVGNRTRRRRLHNDPCKPRALTRAISNLVDNGTKFANLVVVRLAVHTTGAVQISVIDDGPGVAEELRQKVLDPFFKASTARTATDHGGFGLGLSIVNDIVRGHGGSVRLLDGPSGGLTVSVDLPAPVYDLSHDDIWAKPKAPMSGRQRLLASNNS